MKCPTRGCKRKVANKTKRGNGKLCSKCYADSIKTEYAKAYYARTKAARLAAKGLAVEEKPKGLSPDELWEQSLRRSLAEDWLN